MRLIILHSLFSRQFAEHGRPACRLISSKQGAQRLLEDRLKFTKHFRAQRPVDNAMVARERHRHLRGEGDASVCCLDGAAHACAHRQDRRLRRSEEHTSELQSLMRISYAVFCLKKKKKEKTRQTSDITNTPTQYTIHN